MKLKLVSMCQGPQRGFGPEYEAHNGEKFDFRWVGVGLYSLDDEGEVHALVRDWGAAGGSYERLYWLPLQAEPLPYDWTKETK